MEIKIEYAVDVALNLDKYGGFVQFLVHKRIPQILNDGSYFAGPPGSELCWTVNKVITHLKYWWN